jgi:hypothetical protein
MKAGINFNDLPPLFQDVVNAGRILGIEYIWIDRLCIIQGDEGDFHTQAPKMGQIYGAATLTIAAASAGSEMDHILTSRGDLSLTYDMDMNVSVIGSLKLRLRRLSHKLGMEESGGEYGKISTRAWVWQERLLAARTVFYTPGAIKFECRCQSFWEGFDKGRTGHSWSAKLDNMDHLAWTGLVEEYMARDITRPSDRLPAMEAVMKRIENSTGWSPFWGLWAGTLVESLSWQTKESSRSGRHEGRMNPAFYAPSWSWASIDGPISYVSAKPFSGMEQTDPMQWDLECRSLNEASGLIRVAGHIVMLEFHCTVEDTRDEKGATADEGEGESTSPLDDVKFRYRYEVKGPSDPKGFPVKADVALKQWLGIVNGQLMSSVVRVPHGEDPPDKSWKSHCLCLLLGKRKLRALVLFLGRSQRIAGAWERVGMVDGISPAVFLQAPRQIIDIA